MAFNINDYKYELQERSFEWWQQSFLPQKNPLSPRGKFNATMFEHAGAQWNYIIGKHAQQLWTLLEEEDGTLVIRNGIYVKGRKGYFFCERWHNPRELFRVIVPAALAAENGLVENV